jgi:hypothetical protein
MDPLQHAPDEQHLPHLVEALRVLSLPLDVNGLHWHPFGVYGVPLARRVDADAVYSRRLHLWHPEAVPVGETSLYGVHTHSGAAHSHVLVGALQHHLYDFVDDADGVWKRCARADTRMTTLRAHLQAPTSAGVTHTLPAHQAHGVSKPPGWAISLFEQREEGRQAPFTTWQRTDAPDEELQAVGPVPRSQVLGEARGLVEEALARVDLSSRVRGQPSGTAV